MPAPECPLSTAVMLIAHGSRRQTANDDLLGLVELLESRGSYAIVEPAFLELAEPTIPHAAETCVVRGACRVLMLPFFLSAGNHVTVDLQRYAAEFAVAYPQAEFVICPPLGLHPLMLSIVEDRLRQGVEQAAAGSTDAVD
ncbi:MAG: CbiX/SirB N-terminal domain-containing protein [Planctomycetaceae bacterium]